MAKILITYFSKLIDKNGQPSKPCFYETFINGMIENGNDVFVIQHDKFNIDFGYLNDINIIKAIRTFDPDIAFIFNNSFYDLSKIFDFPIVIYDVDSPRYFSNKDIIKNNSSRYKFITSQISTVGTLSSQYGVDKKEILRIPFFTAIKNENKPKINNICFIGTRFPYRNRHGISPWNKFMASNPGQEYKQLYREMIDGIKRYPAQAEKILNVYATRGLNADYLSLEDDLCMFLSGAKREQVLSQVSDLGLVIYGKNEWIFDSTVDMELALAYNATPISSVMDNQNVYNSSKIGININHIQADTGFSWRVLDIMASGACLVTEYNKRLVELFPHINIPFFIDRFEARNVCKKLLNNEVLRSEIVKQCNEAIEGGYRFNHVIKDIEDFTCIKIASPIEGNFRKDVQPYILYLS